MKLLKTYTEWRDAGYQMNTIFDDVHLFDSLGFDSLALNQYFHVHYENQYIGFAFDNAGDKIADESNLAVIARIQDLIRFHALSNKYKYEKLIASMNFDYNPIENYKMTESGTDTHSYGERNTKHTPDGVEDKVTTSSNVSSSSTSQDTLNTTTKTSSTTFDSSTQDPTSQTEVTGNPSSTASSSSTGSNTVTTLIKNGYTDVTTQKDDTTNHTFTRAGNIGVTTSQQMIESERQLVDFNVIDIYFKDVTKLFLSGVWKT